MSSGDTPPIFLADAMLGSMARKLRIFGFDTLYVSHIHDDDVLAIALAQNRVILTCDRELFKRAVKIGVNGVLLDCLDEYTDLVHIFSKNCIRSVDHNNSRCSSCNGILEQKKAEQVSPDVPVNILQRHAKFYLCIECGKIYWEGSHLERIQALAKKINTALCTP